MQLTLSKQVCGSFNYSAPLYTDISGWQVEMNQSMGCHLLRGRQAK